MQARGGGQTSNQDDAGADRPTALPAGGRLLAIDIGDKRIGIAVTDPTQMVAQPLATLSRRAGQRFPMNQLREHLVAQTPVGVVIGLPLTQEGQDDARTQEARVVGRLIHEKTRLPIALVDERHSTATALSAIKDLGGRTRQRKGDVDQLAATVILQRFLEQRSR